MPYCRCGNKFPAARARLGFDCCLECGTAETAAETARRAHMIAPISHKSGYTYLGPDSAAQFAFGAFSPNMPHMVRPVLCSIPLVTLTIRAA